MNKDNQSPDQLEGHLKDAYMHALTDACMNHRQLRILLPDTLPDEICEGMAQYMRGIIEIDSRYRRAHMATTNAIRSALSVTDGGGTPLGVYHFNPPEGMIYNLQQALQGGLRDSAKELIGEKEQCKISA